MRSMGNLSSFYNCINLFKFCFAVALLDSLDSTLGTKPAASREAKDDMKTIPEGAVEQEGVKREEVGEGEMRGGTLTEDTDGNRDTINRGVTLKTATGECLIIYLALSRLHYIEGTIMIYQSDYPASPGSQWYSITNTIVKFVSKYLL